MPEISPSWKIEGFRTRLNELLHENWELAARYADPEDAEFTDTDRDFASSLGISV